jgi:hypothetical protein
MQEIKEGGARTHLHAVLPVSTSQAEQVHLACSLREKLGCVHRRDTTSRCEGLAGLVSGRGDSSSANTQFKALTTTT